MTSKLELLLKKRAANNSLIEALEVGDFHKAEIMGNQVKRLERKIEALETAEFVAELNANGCDILADMVAI